MQAKISVRQKDYDSASMQSQRIGCSEMRKVDGMEGGGEDGVVGGAVIAWRSGDVCGSAGARWVWEGV